MVRQEVIYDKQDLAKKIRALIEAAKLPLVDDSLSNPTPGEAIDSIIVNVPDVAARNNNDPVSLMVIFHPDAPSIIVTGFEFTNKKVNAQLAIVRAILEGTIAYREYTKRRLSPFKTNVKIELTITSKNGEWKGSTWNDELKRIPTQLALDSLNVKEEK